MKMSTYLTFDGDCEAAFHFYRRVLGGRIEAMMTHGDSPICNDVPFEWYDRILHACLDTGDYLIMGSDAPPGHFQRPAGMSVALAFDDPADAERVFEALADGGNVRVPMREAFWARRFGMVTDRFGIPWIVNGGPVDRPAETEGESSPCMNPGRAGRSPDHGRPGNH